MSLEFPLENQELGSQVPELPRESRFAEHERLDFVGSQLALKDAVLDNLPTFLLQPREGVSSRVRASLGQSWKRRAANQKAEQEPRQQ